MKGRAGARGAGGKVFKERLSRTVRSHFPRKGKKKKRSMAFTHIIIPSILTLTDG